MQDLARARRHGYEDAAIQGSVVPRCTDQRQVFVAGIDRATDAHLPDRCARHAAYRHHVPRTGGRGYQWLQRVEIDHLHLVIRGTGVRPERDPLVGTLLLG